MIVFYKVTQNFGLFFNAITLDFFIPFFSEILAFFFVMVHCGITEYQDSGKVIIPFDRKTVYNI